MGLIEFMKNVFEILGKVLEEHYAIGAMIVLVIIYEVVGWARFHKNKASVEYYFGVDSKKINPLYKDDFWSNLFAKTFFAIFVFGGVYIIFWEAAKSIGWKRLDDVIQPNINDLPGIMITTYITLITFLGIFINWNSKKFIVCGVDKVVEEYGIYNMLRNMLMLVGVAYILLLIEEVMVGVKSSNYLGIYIIENSLILCFVLYVCQFIRIVWFILDLLFGNTAVKKMLNVLYKFFRNDEMEKVEWKWDSNILENQMNYLLDEYIKYSEQVSKKGIRKIEYASYLGNKNCFIETKVRSGIICGLFSGFIIWTYEFSYSHGGWITLGCTLGILVCTLLCKGLATVCIGIVYGCQGYQITLETFPRRYVSEYALRKKGIWYKYIRSIKNIVVFAEVAEQSGKKKKLNQIIEQIKTRCYEDEKIKIVLIIMDYMWNWEENKKIDMGISADDRKKYEKLAKAFIVDKNLKRLKKRKSEKASELNLDDVNKYFNVDVKKRKNHKGEPMKQSKQQILIGLILFLIILFLDIWNVFSQIINSIGAYEFVTIGIVVGLIFCIYFRVDVSIKMPIYLEIDKWVSSLLDTLGLYFLFEVMALVLHTQIFAWYKLVGTISYTAICCILQGYRKKVRIKTEKEYTNIEQANTYSLKDLYNGNLNEYNDTLILLDEEAVDYDLLHREEVIESIVRTVEDCYPNKKFVLSLSGNWGSGKTTILNIVKKKLRKDEKIIVIDDFDPWNYEDEAALFGGILDTIFERSGVDYSVIRKRRWKRDLLSLIFNISETTRGVKFSFLNSEDQKTISDIRNSINAYLALSKYRLVFVLDNIERLGTEKMLLLLKTVADVLNFDKVIYILSYDPRILEHMLVEQHYGKEYLKKIVQMEFCVPELDNATKQDLLFHCINNLMQTYQIKDAEKREIFNCLPLIAEYIQDVRDVKRFLNSIMSILYFFSEEQGKHLAAQLNISDYIILEFIKRENRELYETIWKNAEYFVSSDRQTMFGFELFMDQTMQKRNQQTKEFYGKLFENEKNRRYQKLLSKLFPYMEHYTAHKDDILNYEYGDENYEKTIKKHRIYSGNFFPIYFTRHKNENLDIQNAVGEFIGLCNENKKEDATAKLYAVCKKYEEEEQTLLFERIQLYTTDLTQGGWEILFDILYDYAASADDTMLFLRLSAKRRAIYILSLALEQVSKEFFDHFLMYAQNEYSKMNMIHSIIWHNRVEGSEETEVQFKGRAAEVYETLLNMAVHIIEQKIDLYKDGYYKNKNIWGWYHALKYNKNVNIKEAFRYMLTPDNIFRFLWDMTGESLSGVYGYRLYKDNFELFCDFGDIEKIMVDCEPKMEDEKFVQEIYDAYKDSTNREDGTIYRELEVKLRL